MNTRLIAEIIPYAVGEIKDHIPPEDVCHICGGEGFIYSTKGSYEFADECGCQVPLKVERYLKHSGIDVAEYMTKTLENFQVDTEEATKMKKIAMKFIADNMARGLGYFGKSGTGKTHICIAVCQELTRKRLVPHLYFSYRAEIQRLKASFFDKEEYSRLMGKWTSCKILYIDDLLKFAIDKNGQIQIQDLQIMFDIINTRYTNKAITIFSSEYTLDNINKMDSALGSRIYEMINPYRMKCDAENRRLRKVCNQI